MTLLSATKLKFKTDDDKILFQDLSFDIKTNERIGLIGPNGSGKTTLMKIIAGLIQPMEGSISQYSKIYYLPQLINKSNLSVLDYLSNQSDEWWQIIQIAKDKFDYEIDANQLMFSLSGGEVMKINLCIGLSLKPDILLLDEPTNHIDISSKLQLESLIKAYSGAVMIVSHDTFFLDRAVNEIWEFQNGKINLYGGNYSFYKQRKIDETTGRQKDYENALKELKKAKNAVRKETIIHEKDISKHKALAKSGLGGIAPLFAGNMKDAAEKSHSKIGTSLHALEKKKEEKLEELKETKRKTAFLSVEESGHKKRSLINIQNATLSIDNKIYLHDINLQVNNGDKISISGQNGTGKSAFVRSIIISIDKQQKERTGPVLTGYIVVSTKMQFEYIDQKYSLVDRNLSLYQNISMYDPQLNNEAIRKQLGNFLFITDFDIQKNAELLSGGEIARLAFAMITAKNLDLLILDEPTNNLDIDTVDIIIRGLNNYHGGLIVISHNIDFLSSINITDSYLIKNKRLEHLKILPSDKERFLEEITK